MITNLRVRLLQRQQCPCQAKHAETDVLSMEHYAIYDFIVKGSCLCNGHADHCVPARGYQPRHQKMSNVVSFTCLTGFLKTFRYRKCYFTVCSIVNVKSSCVCLQHCWCCEIGGRKFGVLFPPLVCYSAVCCYLLLELRDVVKTAYQATTSPTITGI